MTTAAAEPAEVGSAMTDRTASLRAEMYVAIRWHPALGPLFKIGVSIDADRRCRSLGAQRIPCELLPRRSERELKDLLAPWRAFTRDARGQYDVDCLFHAPTEWYLKTPGTEGILAAYFKLQRALGRAKEELDA